VPRLLACRHERARKQAPLALVVREFAHLGGTDRRCLVYDLSA
jgi:hypothetical protein